MGLTVSFGGGNRNRRRRSTVIHSNTRPLGYKAAFIIFLIAGLIFLGIGAFLVIDTTKNMSNGIEVEGTVASYKWRGDDTYSAVYTFRYEGIDYWAISQSSSSFPPAIGSKTSFWVNIATLAASSENSPVPITEDIRWLGYIFGGAGVIAISGGTYAFISGRKREQKEELRAAKGEE